MRRSGRACRSSTRRLLFAIVALSAAASSAGAQGYRPRSAPEVPAPARRSVDRLRGAWLRHDAAALVGSSRIVVQLPGQGPTAPLAPEQASRTIEALFRDATEASLEVVSVRGVDVSTIYAELRRRYRVRGTQELLVQPLFAAFRITSTEDWDLVELRASGPESP